MFGDIYGLKNHAFAPRELWARMLEETGELVKPVQTLKPKEVDRHLPDILAWLCAFSNKLNLQLSDVLWEKFKNGCPGCRRFKDCTCPRPINGISKNPTTTEAARQASLAEKLPEAPMTIDEWQTFFREMYGLRNEDALPANLLAEMTVDIGEVARILRRREDVGRLKSKIASSTAWLFAICNRYSAAGTGEYWLSDIAWTKYRYQCPKCFARRCECKGPIASVFVSYPQELENEMRVAKDVITAMGLQPLVFQDLGPDFDPNRMVEALRAVGLSDAAIVLIDNRLSPGVFAEYHEALMRLDPNHVFVFVTKEPRDGTKRKGDVDRWLDDIGHTHRYERFGTPEDLRRNIDDILRKSQEEAKRYL